MQSPSDRRYCVPSFLKHENLPCKLDVTVEVADVDPEVVTVEVAVLDTVFCFDVTVDVAVVVSVVKSHFV